MLKKSIKGKIRISQPDSCLLLFYSLVILREREKESTHTGWVGEGEREGERESQEGSELSRVRSGVQSDEP